MWQVIEKGQQFSHLPLLSLDKSQGTSGVEQGDKKNLHPDSPEKLSMWNATLWDNHQINAQVDLVYNVEALEKCVSVFHEHQASFLISSNLPNSLDCLRQFGKKEKFKNKFFQTTENVLKFKNHFLFVLNSYNLPPQQNRRFQCTIYSRATPWLSIFKS